MRNVNKGLSARTKIIQSLETKERRIKEISKGNNLSYDCVRYHLKTLKKEGIVRKYSKNRPFVWILTGKGQQKLV
jgi:predicted transcriptional regulator